MEKILIIDDDKSINQTLCNFLKREKYEVFSAENGAEGLKLFEKNKPDLIISDLRMPEMDGLVLLDEIKKRDQNIPFIIITAFDEMQSTITAMQKGAFDYIEKPLEIDKMRNIIRKALDSKKLSEDLDEVDNNGQTGSENILIGKSQQMREIYKRIGQVSGSNVAVLVQGESGTGKELVARAIHKNSYNKNEPFVAVNCSALTESLLESELFGHIKGAFTGSVKDKKGKFELAGNGTIFLDEISEISPAVQVKLLRVLQEREFEPVGGEVSFPMKARVIAATNRNLEAMVKNGEFREDLFYRLKVVTIETPPLRDKKEDIPLLVNHFLGKINAQLHKKVNKISPEVMEILENYDWVGNVRELENSLMQAMVLASGDVIQKENLLLRDKELTSAGEFDDVTKYSLADVEKNHIMKMLEALNWDKAKAAKKLGISLPTLYSKIESYKIEKVKN